MKQFDMDGYEKNFKENAARDGHSLPYAGKVLEEVVKVKMQALLETRPFTFSDGVVGEVANKLTIEIDFSGVTVQPDQDFEDHYMTHCADEIENHIENSWDNQD